jgi:hypothetical protein
MNIGTKKWHETLSEFLVELESLGGILAALALLVVAFVIEHHLHGR